MPIHGGMIASMKNKFGATGYDDAIRVPPSLRSGGTWRAGCTSGRLHFVCEAGRALGAVTWTDVWGIVGTVDSEMAGRESHRQAYGRRAFVTARRPLRPVYSCSTLGGLPTVISLRSSCESPRMSANIMPKTRMKIGSPMTVITC